MVLKQALPRDFAQSFLRYVKLYGVMIQPTVIALMQISVRTGVIKERQQGGIVLAKAKGNGDSIKPREGRGASPDRRGGSQKVVSDERIRNKSRDFTNIYDESGMKPPTQGFSVFERSYLKTSLEFPSVCSLYTYTIMRAFISSHSSS